MDDAARTELHAELRPWMCELRSTVLDIPTHADAMLWVEVIFRGGGHERQLFESLELLALVGGVDDRLWLDLINDVVPRKSDKIRDGRARAIGLELKLRVASADAIPTVCERLVVGGIEAVVPSKYQTVRTRLERLYAAQEEAYTGSRATSKIPRAQLKIPVRLVSADLDVEIRLRQLVQVASMQCLRDTSYSPAFQNDAWRPLFRVVSIDPSTPSSLSAKAMLYLGQISACGIDIKIREHVEQLALHDEARPVVARTLQALFAIVSDTPPPRERHGIVSSVGVSYLTKPSTAACLLSALGCSQSIKSLTLGSLVSPMSFSARVSIRGARDHLWAWIGFSIFGPHASHAIEQVTIHAEDLTQEDAAACLNAMNATGGLPMLRENGDAQPPTVQQEVSASRFCLTRPTDSTEIQTVQLASQRVLLLRQDDPFTGGWVKVLLPGCGLAWVRHDDVEVLPPATTRSHSCIRQLEVTHLTNTSKRPAQDLVCAIGTSLTRLVVAGFQCDERFDDWLHAVFASCPQLEELALSTTKTSSGIASMEVFSDAYARGTCRLKNLELLGVNVENRDSMARFFDVLRDKDHAMTKHLRVFTYFFDTPTTPFPNFVPAMEAALQVNRRLEDIAVRMNRVTDAQPEDPAVLRRLTAHYGDVLPIPLALATKLAFLSVVMGSQYSHETVSPSVRELDRSMVTRIFDFAAGAKKRCAVFLLWANA